MVLRASGVVGLVAVAACTDARTPTSALEISLEGTFDAHALTLDLGLADTTTGTPGNPGPYLIDPSEHLIVTFRDKTLELTGGSAYATRAGAIAVDDVVAADEQVTLTFERGSETIVLAAGAPAPFALTAPAMSPLAQDLTVTWTPTSAESMQWKANGCDSGDGPIPLDAGTITFPPGALVDPQSMYSCTVELAFLRTRVTRPATALRIGEVSLTQLRTVDVSLTP